MLYLCYNVINNIQVIFMLFLKDFADEQGLFAKEVATDHFVRLVNTKKLNTQLN